MSQSDHGESPPDVEVLDLGGLKRLCLQWSEEIAAPRPGNAALRAETARLKGLKGRPKIKPSAMERKTEPKAKPGRHPAARRLAKPMAVGVPIYASGRGSLPGRLRRGAAGGRRQPA